MSHPPWSSGHYAAEVEAHAPVAGPPGSHRGGRGSGHLVPVTVWVHPDRLAPAHRAPGRWGPEGRRRLYVLAGLVVAVAVVATLAVCLAVALLALVAWVSAHAVAVGTAVVAVVVTALAFVGVLARARSR